jgi:hypothetical protein
MYQLMELFIGRTNPGAQGGEKNRGRTYPMRRHLPPEKGYFLF